MVQNLALIAFMGGGGLICIVQRVSNRITEIHSSYSMDQNRMLIMMKEGLVNFLEILD